MTDKLNLQQLDNDPRLPMRGSIDFERVLYVRLYELFRAIAGVTNQNGQAISDAISNVTTQLTEDINQAIAGVTNLLAEAHVYRKNIINSSSLNTPIEQQVAIDNDAKSWNLDGNSQIKLVGDNNALTISCSGTHNAKVADINVGHGDIHYAKHLGTLRLQPHGGTVSINKKIVLHKGNTTTDSNGFIKDASPIIKLFNNTIDKTEHLEIAETELERVGVGHYVLHSAPLLSRDGWYIETPKDRNNNIYFYLDYVENETDKTLTIKTYKPDYSTGRAEAGEPVDILEGRFVSLRFEEDESLYVEQEIGND